MDLAPFTESQVIFAPSNRHVPWRHLPAPWEGIPAYETPPLLRLVPFYRAFVDKEFIGLNFQPSALTSYISFAEEKRHGYVKTGFAGFWPLFSVPAFSFFPAGSFDYSDFCGLVLLGSLFLNLIRMNFFIIRPGNILSLSSCCQKLCFSFGLSATISVIRYRPPIMIITGFGILFPFYSWSCFSVFFSFCSRSGSVCWQILQ